MTAQTLAPPRFAGLSRELTIALPVLALGTLAMGAIFHQEVTAAIGVWMESTAYNHCFLIIPIAAYLIWDRRAVLAGAIPRPLPLVALAALPFGLVWLLADRVGIMEGRQLMAMAMLELLFLAVLGWRICNALLGPLLYLLFLVPFGAFITPLLQDFTTGFVTHGLDLLGIATYADGYSIEIPEGTFYVAQACAGLRFLVAAVAFGCLYALLMYRSPLRRGLFILVSVIVPIIANGFRALGIVVLGHLLGSAQAAATDHVLYGWIFFSIVILLLVAFGLPFREDDRVYTPLPDTPGDAGPPVRGPAIATVAVLALAAVGPLLAAGLDRASAAGLPATAPSLPTGPCTLAAPSETSISDAPGRVLVQHLACPGGRVTVRLEVFPPRTQPGLLTAEQRQSGVPGGELLGTSPLRVHGLRWQLVTADDPPRTGAVLLWAAGHPSGVNLRMRVSQGWASIAGGASYPLVISVLPDPDPSPHANGFEQAKQQITDFLRSRPDLPDALARIAAEGH